MKSSDPIRQLRTGQCDHYLFESKEHDPVIQSYYWEAADNNEVETLQKRYQQAEDAGDWMEAVKIDARLEELMNQYEEGIEGSE